MTPERFVFESYAFDAGVLTFRYAYPGGPSFVETIAIGAPQRVLPAADVAALDRAIRLLFLLCGVSYYKAYVPPRLTCDAFALDGETAAFVREVYESGLGEFAFRNGLDLAGRIAFETVDVAPAQGTALHLPRRALVPVGGGKDSIVSIETLREIGEDMTLFVVAPPGAVPLPIAATIDAARLPFLHAKRSIARTLIALNTQPGVLNGHVPITAIVSMIAVVCAIAHGYDTVVLSNERSASAPNLVAGGREINHQYSKSFAFERALSAFVRRHIAADLSYFSLLRPLSETAIARRFAALPAYHAIFRSCNTAFRQDEAARGTQWCGDCPKCRFVFLALAPFLPRDALTAIFARDLLDDPAQTQGFAELCGLSSHKPFECVGEIEESALLMRKALRLAAWKDAAVVAALGPKLDAAGGDFDAEYARLFALDDENAVPARYLEHLHARF